MKKRLGRGPVLALGAVAVCVVGAAIGIGACGKNHGQSTASPGSTGLFVDPEDSAHPQGATVTKFELDDRGKDLLERAKAGDESDVSRFATYVGAAALIELSRKDDTRSVAIAAMAYSPGFSCAGVLAETATDGTDPDAVSALEGLHAIAARPREQVDLEDFAELEFTCEKLLALAKDPSESRKDRARRATSVLRMLVDRGCEAPPIVASPPSTAPSGATPGTTPGAASHGAPAIDTAPVNME